MIIKFRLAAQSSTGGHVNSGLRLFNLKVTLVSFNSKAFRAATTNITLFTVLLFVTNELNAMTL